MRELGRGVRCDAREERARHLWIERELQVLADATSRKGAGARREKLPLPNKGFRATALLATVEDALITGLKAKVERLKMVARQASVNYDGMGVGRCWFNVVFDADVKRYGSVATSQNEGSAGVVRRPATASPPQTCGMEPLGTDHRKRTLSVPHTNHVIKAMTPLPATRVGPLRSSLSKSPRVTSGRFREGCIARPDSREGFVEEPRFDSCHFV